MHILIETHSAENLQWIHDLNPPIVGVNCRNLKTMTTNIEWFEEAYSQLPKDSIKVAESGINSPDNLAKISQMGYDAALVGTSLMKTGTPGSALATLLRRTPV